MRPSTVHKPTPTLLAVGPWGHGEFATVRNDLDPARRWPTASSLNEALNRTANLQAPPELILLAQPRPGCGDQTEIERWRTACPLTRIVVIAGAWCEGELRTGRPLTGVIRLYWHELAPWWRGALTSLAKNRNPPWSAPLTVTGGTSATAGSPSSAPRVHAVYQSQPLLAIDALDLAVFESIESALKSAAWRCVWQPRHRPDLWSNSNAAHPAAGLWDGAQLDPAEQHHLKMFCTRLAKHQASIVALLDFPRPEHLEIATSCGATSILGKPYPISALIECLDASKHHASGNFATGCPV